QCELARLDEGDERHAALLGRQTGLLAEHADLWRREAPRWAWKQCGFRRGFVASWQTSAERFLDRAEKLCRAVPLEAVEWAAAPNLARLTRLRLAHSHVPAAALIDLLASPRLPCLTALDLRWNDFGPAGAGAFLAAPVAARLRALSLSSDDQTGLEVVEQVAS